MNILVWGINYAPEVTGIAPYNTVLCEHLRAQGHQVRMLTSFAYYPAWEKLPEDSGTVFRRDVVNEVEVHRCWHYVPRKPSALKRILHEGSFVFMSFLRALLLPRPDVMVVVSPPLLLGAAAWLLTRFKRWPFLFHVQDLQPDAAVGLGMVRDGALVRALYALEHFAYRKAAAVSSISKSMLALIARKGIAKEKLILFPNGVSLPKTMPERGKFRQRMGFAAADFIAVYSGNLGMKQGLDVLIQAGRSVTNARIKIVICGDGANRERLAEIIDDTLRTRVHLLPLQAEEHYFEMMADADLTIVTQQAGAGGCFFPSKLLKSLAMGKPVLTVCDPEGDLGRFTSETGFGCVVPPDDGAKLAAVFELLADDPALLEQQGKAALAAALSFDQVTIHKEFEKELLALVPEAVRARQTAASIPATTGQEARTTPVIR